MTGNRLTGDSKTIRDKAKARGLNKLASLMKGYVRRKEILKAKCLLHQRPKIYKIYAIVSRKQNLRLSNDKGVDEHTQTLR